MVERHTAGVTTIGFLHTSSAHQPTFDALVAELIPGAQVQTVVDEIVLDRARLLGPDHVEIIGAIADRLAQLHTADVVVCTCSTIGGVAEWVGAEAGVRVVRVDRAMAELAVTTGDRIAVIVAVESTIAPTRDLLDETSMLLGRNPEIEVHLVADAWRRFEAGDNDGYLDTIAAAVEGAAKVCDVVVLAQASMAEAGERVVVGVPVLSSPRTAVDALARAAGA